MTDQALPIMPRASHRHAYKFKLIGTREQDDLHEYRIALQLYRDNELLTTVTLYTEVNYGSHFNLMKTIIRENPHLWTPGTIIKHTEPATSISEPPMGTE